ncbi:MAG: hypothetical protein ABIC04_04070 [Nanoarchaeota archaeon]
MKIRMMILGLFVITVLCSVVMAAPYGPTSIENVTTYKTNTSVGTPQALGAHGGNNTQLEINISQATGNWQGYFGNISGKVVLGDVNGNTMYDWTAGSSFSPIGEIYAANATIVDWGDVICLNLTGNGSIDGSNPPGINNSILESMYGMLAADTDGIDETFNSINNITIAGTLIDNCWATNTYDSNGVQTTKFNETLLTEKTQGTVIYATQVDQDTVGYDGNRWDFQMIVADDGSDGVATAYYFYVELA